MYFVMHFVMLAHVIFLNCCCCCSSTLFLIWSFLGNDLLLGRRNCGMGISLVFVCFSLLAIFEIGFFLVMIVWTCLGSLMSYKHHTFQYQSFILWSLVGKYLQYSNYSIGCFLSFYFRFVTITRYHNPSDLVSFLHSPMFKVVLRYVLSYLRADLWFLSNLHLI